MPTQAAEHQASQATLVAALGDQLAQVWPNFDVSNLNQSIPGLSTEVAALVHQYGIASASVAADYYEAERLESGVRGPFSVMPALPADLEQVTEAVKWATKGLWSAKPDLESAQTLVSGVAEKYVLDTGRSTIIDAVQADRKARGWARVVEPGACSFCLLLATRGAVYRSEESADFHAHDHDRCHVQPVFGIYEPTAEIRQAQDVYRSIKATRGGPQAVRNAFRQAIEAGRS